MIINRCWAMPSHETFSIPPIADLLCKLLQDKAVIVDPFARNSRLATHRNDLNPDAAAESHLTALDYLKLLLHREISADVVLIDPPYSYRQVVECYQSVGREFTAADQQNVQRWSAEKDLAKIVLRDNGLCVCFGWNSTGMGKTRGFELEEVLLVNHGGGHHDTIVTVERKLPHLFP